MFGFLKKLLTKSEKETITQAEYEKLCAQTTKLNRKARDIEDVEETNPDQSVYSDNPEDTQENLDMESDLGLLEDAKDDLW